MRMLVHRTACGQQGFSLLEAMVVVTIMVILSSVMLPSYVRMANRTRLNGATRELVSDIMRVRMQSVSQSKQFMIQCNGARYQIFRDNNGNGLFESSELFSVREVARVYSGVNVSGPSGTTSALVFNPRGTVTGSTVSVTNSMGTKRVVVNIAGRVRVES
jgi:prepilin-type N-terminal cleavage/methylation domain-containing protein